MPLFGTNSVISVLTVAACVASVNFKVSKCHHTDSNARLTRSATFAGMAKVVNSEIIHSVWITARHGGMVDGTEVLIRLGKDAVVGTCIYDDANSDVSIIAGSPMNGFADAGQLSYSHEITQGKLVGILGFPMNSDPNLGRAALITGYIASTVTGGRTGLPAEATEWRSQRFFLVDKNCDFGMSGGPIIDAQGGVVGMLCASCTANIQSSWAVLSSYMCDALDAVVVAWV